MVERLDQDGDGLLTEEEWDADRVQHMEPGHEDNVHDEGGEAPAGPATFDEMDLNGDGKLSEEEVLEDMLTHMHEGNPTETEEAAAASNIGEMFTHLDTDGDGFVSEEEWDEELAAHRGVEVENGVITQLESINSDPKLKETSMDTDGDGFITLEEFQDGIMAHAAQMHPQPTEEDLETASSHSRSSRT